MMKRTFWALMIFERNMSSALGRSCSIQDEDFDLDLPIECDDEYWTNANSALAFTQPAGKPSTVSHFVCCIRITQIHAFALRTIDRRGSLPRLHFRLSLYAPMPPAAVFVSWMCNFGAHRHPV
ncbi:hypothetical protein PHLCEN_2v12900 [Hermanssonia centrifuga]|uniref:Xylanolytic transcriptional activator regulatory domain-containing protein n=1 Tax=Hermanssonia centrifuga TaxID=98765 RepID=A0A2R6NFW7_9APHY|nr:hypothetical protein PHLCEN_2v12900 [Hermanssonia centrifuga]